MSTMWDDIRGKLLKEARENKSGAFDEAAALAKVAEEKARHKKVEKRVHAEIEDMGKDIGAFSRYPGEGDEEFKRRIRGVLGMEDKPIDEEVKTDKVTKKKKAEADWFLDELDKI